MQNLRGHSAVGWRVCSPFSPVSDFAGEHDAAGWPRCRPRAQGSREARPVLGPYGGVKRKPRAATHWSTRKLADELGVSHMMIARVWRKPPPLAAKGSPTIDEVSSGDHAADSRQGGCWHLGASWSVAPTIRYFTDNNALNRA